MSVTWRAQEVQSDLVLCLAPMVANRDWLFRVLLTSDHHFDSAYCDRKLLKRLLQEAVDCGAPIHFNGDTLDVMQAQGDPRASKRELMSGYVGNGETDPRCYLDRVVDDAAEFYAPFAENILTISEGNHEDSLIKKTESNIIQRLTGILNKQHGGRVNAAPYAGYIKFQFTDGSVITSHQKKRQRGSALIHYHHGYGGGMAKIAMRAAMYPDADICLSGHSHEFEVGKEWGQQRVTDSGRVYIKNQTHIILPTLKDESRAGGRGYATVKFHKHRVLGAVWLTFKYNRADCSITWQTTQAR